MVGWGGYQRLQKFAFLALAAATFTTAAAAQGILTVTPGRVVSVSAGTGKVDYTGDGGAATSATLAAPSAVAYDAAGNLYLADSLNHVVRRISTGGTITTIAGTGVAGFGGDNGAATAAFLDTPTGVAVDAGGNVYIADSHNHRIRKVTSGTITTIAGTGIAGFSGDGAAATAAQLALPSAVALDASGNLYVADRNNHRIRKITGTTIATIAGDGEELFAGDGGAATAAALDTPSGVAVDAAGNVYIADRNNQRIRVVNTRGTISTLAGSGTSGFSGDGASATAAALAKPTGISVDASGNVYIADTDNQRIREVSGSTIATIVGSGAQGYGADTGTAGGTNLNEPKAVTPDSVGNLAIGDRLNQRLRAAALPAVAFTASGAGVSSTPQPVTLANTGSAPITISGATFTGSFAAGSSPCGSLPITLAAGASCVENLVFSPSTTGPATGTVIFSGAGVLPAKLLLSGSAGKSATSVVLTSTAASPFAGQPVTFTAGVTVPGSVPATGTIIFLDGTTPIGSATLVNGIAAISTTALPDGAQNLTATYAGDPNYTASASAALPEVVIDFNFALASTSSSSQTVVPGQAAVYNFTIQPLAGPFSVPIILSATGLPPGATVVFNPQTITLGANPSSFTMTIQTQIARLRRMEFFGGTTVALGMLLWPFSRRTRRRRSRFPGSLCIAALLSVAAVAGLSGCGSGTGFLGETTRSYTITITATATNQGATLQRTATATLIVQ